jgi:hypothetical protein
MLLLSRLLPQVTGLLHTHPKCDPRATKRAHLHYQPQQTAKQHVDSLMVCAPLSLSLSPSLSLSLSLSFPLCRLSVLSVPLSVFLRVFLCARSCGMAFPHLRSFPPELEPLFKDSNQLLQFASLRGKYVMEVHRGRIWGQEKLCDDVVRCLEYNEFDNEPRNCNALSTLNATGNRQLNIQFIQFSLYHRHRHRCRYPVYESIIISLSATVCDCLVQSFAIIVVCISRTSSRLTVGCHGCQVVMVVMVVKLSCVQQQVLASPAKPSRQNNTQFYYHIIHTCMAACPL